MHHENTVRRWLRYRFPHNAHNVDDVLQETYTRLLARPHDQPVESVFALMLTIARNVTVDMLRKSGEVPACIIEDLEALDLEDESPSPDELAAQSEDLALVEAVTQSLSATARQVFTLRKVYGYSQREIADRLGITEHAVEQHVARAVNTYRKAFSARDAVRPRRSLRALVRMMRKRT